MIELLRWVGPPVLAALTVVALDRLMDRRGLLPPLFRAGPPPDTGGPALVRRVGAALLLFFVFWITVYAAVGLLGTTATTQFVAPDNSRLFLVHAILMVTVGVWFALGFVGAGDGVAALGPRFARQFGMRAPALGYELGLGLVAGVAIWLAVITLLIGLAALVWLLGGKDALPTEPPAMVPWIAGLPLVLRLALSASAGFFEELFFRGFLQPRVGIAMSTVLFALAHLSYDQPMMLVGVTLLSLTFAFLVRWRQNIWAAVVAHAVFDAIQLTLVIPKALEYLESGGAELVAIVCYTAPH